MKQIIIFITFLIFISSCSTIGDNIEIEVTEENIVEINILNSEFTPQDLEIERGTIVKWTNDDSQGHKIASDNLFESKTLTKAYSFSYKFDDVGSYDYFCMIHPDMKGTIVVR